MLAVLEIPLGIVNGRNESSDLRTKVERDASFLAAFAEETLENGTDPRALGVAAADYSKRTGGRVVIVNRRGFAIVDTNPPTSGPRTFATRQEIIDALHGKVATEAEKAKAEDVARRIEGAKEVKNLLQVVPGAQRAIVQRSDDEIKKSVDAAFKANRRVNPSGITVASVNKGVVLLSGKTKSFEAHLESVEVANAVRGVRRVSTEVEVDSPNP